MMRAPLIAIVLSSIGGAVCAQPANEGSTGLESCFQSARAADAICSNPSNNAVQRLDCLQKARTAQLECLEQVTPRAPVGSSASEKAVGTGASEMTSGTASPALPSGAPAPELPTATVPTDEPTAAASPDKPSAMVLPDKPTATASPDEPARTVSPDMPTAIGLPDRPAVAVLPDPPALDAVIPPKPGDWVVSETTSPVDYTPLITAAIRLPSSVKSAPNTLAIRCRGRRTELLVRTEGTWRPSPAGDVHVDYQINAQRRCNRAFAVAAGRRTTENQRVGRPGFQPRRHVSTRRIGCRPRKNCGGMQATAGSERNIVGEALAVDRLHRVPGAAVGKSVYGRM
jgi:hypothetical protein